eukprot:761074-Hanusia_phi.AAC.5
MKAAPAPNFNVRWINANQDQPSNHTITRYSATGQVTQHYLPLSAHVLLSHRHRHGALCKFRTPIRETFKV